MDEIIENYKKYARRCLNGMVINYLKFIESDSKFAMEPVIEASSELLYNRGNDSFKKGTITSNLNEVTISLVIELIKEQFNEYYFLNPSKEFIIDYQFLKNERVIELIKELHEKDYITKLKILDKDYTLTSDDYDKISFLDEISVYNVEENLSNKNISIINENYVSDIGFVKNDEEYELEVNYFLKDDINDASLNEFLTLFEESSNNKINIRFYNPAKCFEIIKKLNDNGLSKKVKINILGYPLDEKSEVYEKLLEEAGDREIEVRYEFCHDIIEMYCKEPFLGGNAYFSDLEPGGVTDLKTYIKILKFLENFEKSVEGIESNMEKTILAYKFLNENYYYDENAGATKEYGDTRDMDKIIDTKEIVCVGYANLLSTMCRKIGIPMFTYGAPGHRMNIARIQEKDENGQIVLDKICTFDPTNDGRDRKNANSDSRKDLYTFFGLDPERWLHTKEPSFLTTANALAVQPKDYKNNCSWSRPTYASQYYSHCEAKTYVPPMLRLMGYNYKIEEQDLDDVIASLHEEKRIGEIPRDLLISSLRNVERRIHSDMSEIGFNEYFESVQDRANHSIDERDSYFPNTIPQINCNDAACYLGEDFNKNVTVSTYNESIPEHNHIDIASIDEGPVNYIKKNPSKIADDNSSNFDDSFKEDDFSEEYIAGTTIRKPRDRNDYETDEDYIDFLDKYYTHYFPNASNNSGDKYKPLQIVDETRTLERYRSEGFNKNVYGHYFNPWSDEYDENYNPLADENYIIYKEENNQPLQVVDETRTLEKYYSEGFNKNVYGHYFNPWTDEYDKNYNPLADENYIIYKEESNRKSRR